MKEKLKVFNDRVPFGDRHVYPSYNPIQLNCNLNSCNLVVQASLSLVRLRSKLIIYLAWV